MKTFFNSILTLLLWTFVLSATYAQNANDDFATVIEDTPTAIDVAANDSDAGGNPLDPCTVTVSPANQPANGTVSTTIDFYTEDFANGIPVFWSNMELLVGGGIWSHSYQAASNWSAFGFPGTLPAFSTATNGFMLFDSDGKGNDGRAEDAELISTAIDCSAQAGVSLQFEQHFVKYQNDITSVGVSTDGVNFTMFVINDGMATNSFTDNPEIVNIDISAIADGQSSVYLKFKYQGDRDYWWMFDDVKLSVKNPGCELVYTPNPDYNGTDSFVYEICDDSGACTTAAVTVTVTPVDDAPVANDDTDTTLEDTPVTTTVTTNDSDADGNLDPTSLTILVGPTNGTLINNVDGTVQYIPNPDYNGQDSFEYQICDITSPTPLCDNAVVTINVSSIEDAPVATDDAATTIEDTQVTITVTDNDTDTDGDLDPTSVTITTPPANGTTTVNIDGTIDYTPGQDYFGVITFEYQICDMAPPTPLCDLAIVTVDVIAGPSYTISGQVNNCAGSNMEQVEMTLTGAANALVFTGLAGFSFADIETGNYTITPSRADNDINDGISVGDLISIMQHLQGDVIMTDPCQLIAADVNRSCGLSVTDIIQIKQVMLGNTNSFPAGDAWRFVPADFVFPLGQFPCNFPESIGYSPLLQDENNQNFIGIKLGDVNGSANPNLKQE